MMTKYNQQCGEVQSDKGRGGIVNKLNNTDVTPSYGFKPGNTYGKGRPKGSRNKFSEAFIQDIHDIWLSDGASALQELRASDVGAFVRVAAGVLPKDLNVSTDGLNGLSLEQIEVYSTILQGIANEQSMITVDDSTDEVGIESTSQAIDKK